MMDKVLSSKAIAPTVVLTRIPPLSSPQQVYLNMIVEENILFHY